MPERYTFLLFVIHNRPGRYVAARSGTLGGACMLTTYELVRFRAPETILTPNPDHHHAKTAVPRREGLLF
jgi:hypothetical protein